MSRPVRLVRFLNADPMGLWGKGDLAEDLGPETPGIPELRLFRLRSSGELISLTFAYTRGLVERVAEGDDGDDGLPPADKPLLDERG